MADTESKGEGKQKQASTGLLDTLKFIDRDCHPRGIPKTIFIEDVEEFYTMMLGSETFSSENVSKVDEALGAIQEHLSKLKFTVEHHERMRADMKQKIPDMEANVEVVNHLMDKKEKDESFDTHYELSDAIYAKATIPPKGVVNLWLGANVMVEFKLDEAHKMLSTNLAGAYKKLGTYEEDLKFIREQVIVSEVNIARVYNFQVRLRRKMKEEKSDAVSVRAKKN